ncbi:MFS transporter [Arenibaculum sp.]|uniref:MFS transporter n=1 Tax=Arenibaculum sp. TaxID=2865862 RepID=UPI002E0DCBF0|nr:MFS transporter [Arenibaculum sp.]
MTGRTTDFAHPPAPEAGHTDTATSLMVRLRIRVLIVTLALIVGAAAALSVVAHRLFEQQLAPEVTRQAATVAEFLAADVERALGYGIAIEDLVGVTEHFERASAPHPEMEYVALHDTGGKLLQAIGPKTRDSADPAVERMVKRQMAAGGTGFGEVTHTHEYYIVMAPVRHDGRVAGIISIGVDASFVQTQLADLAYDIVIILMVALFIAFEILVAVTAGVFTPLRELYELTLQAAAGNLGRRVPAWATGEAGAAVARVNAVLGSVQDRYRRIAAATDGTATALQERLQEIGRRFGLDRREAGAAGRPLSAVDARLPLFVFVFAEELQKSFLPLYVKQLYRPVDWLSPELLIGLPISVYMLALALTTPFAGTWVDRHGARRIFTLGLIPAVAGFIGSAFAGDLFQLLAARTLTAIGYAMITIAAQGYIARTAERAGRAQGMSVFVGVLMAGSICGTAIGGIVAARLGYEVVFLFAAGLAAFAGVLALRMLSPDRSPAGGADAPARPTFRDFATLLGNRRFLALLLLSAIPAKIVLTGFLFYAVPLYLTDLSASEAEIGRVMMLYSLMIIFVGPWASRFADRSGRGRMLVFAGTLASGLAMVLLGWFTDFEGVIVAVAVLSLGHAISISPQIALIPEICRAEIERFGQTTVLGLLRMLERGGSVLGPLLVAYMIASFGYAEGLAYTGGGVALLSLLLPLLIGRRSRPFGDAP